MFKKVLLAVLFCLLIAPKALFAQTKEEKEVAQVIETLKSGMLSGDRNVLQKIAAPELTYGHSSGLIEDKNAFVEALASGKSDFTKIDLTDQVIRVVNNTAVVRHKLTATTNDGGVTGNVKLAVLLVWQKQNGLWKLLARQAVKVQ